MINTADVLKLLSTQSIKYNKNNVKVSIKADGNFKNGNQKYIGTIKDLSGKVLYSGTTCRTERGDLLFDESVFYKVEYEIEE